MFRIIPLDETIDSKQDFKPNSFRIAEYMTYCDFWDIHITDSDYNNYLISNPGEKYRALTNSFAEFLKRFLAGGVFEKGGLYDWHEQIDRQNHV